MSGWSAMAAYALALPALSVVARQRNASFSMTAPGALVLAALSASVIVFCAVRGYPVSLALALALACLVVCAASDLATGLVFDTVTATAACGILFAAIVEAHAGVAVLGAGTCIAPLLALHAVTGGRGIGLGDVKLGGIIGAGVGGVAAIAAIGTAFVAGAICCIPLVLSRRMRRSDRIPFAPFLALGTIILVGARVVLGHG